MPTKKKKFQPGVDPNPVNWHEAAAALHTVVESPKKKIGKSGLYEKIADLERAFREQHGK